MQLLQSQLDLNHMKLLFLWQKAISHLHIEEPELFWESQVLSSVLNLSCKTSFSLTVWTVRSGQWLIIASSCSCSFYTWSGYKSSTPPLARWVEPHTSTLTLYFSHSPKKSTLRILTAADVFRSMPLIIQIIYVSKLRIILGHTKMLIKGYFTE